MSLQWTPWRGSRVCEGLRERALQRLWFAPPHLGDNLLPLLSQPWPMRSVNWATRGHWGMQSHFPVNLPKTDSCFYCPSSFLFNVSCIQECTFKVFPHLGEKTESYLSSPLLPAPHIQQLTHPIALTSAPPLQLHCPRLVRVTAKCSGLPQCSSIWLPCTYLDPLLSEHATGTVIIHSMRWS